MKEAEKLAAEIFVGRDEECARIRKLMDQRKHIVIFGEPGAGKSALVTHILNERTSEYFLYSKESGQLKQALLNLISFREGPTRRIRESNILSLKKMAYKFLDENPAYVILDHVGWVEPRYYGFLTYVMERNIPLIVLPRAIVKKEVGHLWLAMYHFAKVQVANLERSVAQHLICHYVMFLGLEVAHPYEFADEVIRISRGNPRVITQLCWLAQDEKYRAKGYVDVKLIDLDRRIKETTNEDGACFDR